MYYIMLSEHRLVMGRPLRCFETSPLINTDINQYRVGFHLGNCFLIDDAGTPAIIGTDGSNHHVTGNHRFSQYHWLDHRSEHPTPHIVLQASESVERTVKHFDLSTQCDRCPGCKFTHCPST